MINLETPKKIRPLDRAGAPGRDEHAATHLPQVRRGRARVPQGARHARRDDRRHLRVRRHRRRRCRRRTSRREAGGEEGKQERRQPRLGALHHGDVLGRRRPAALDAAPGPGQLRDRLGRQRRAAGAVRRHLGRDGDHRARAPAPTPPTSRPPPPRTATSTSSTARRSTSPPASAPTAWSCGRRSTRASAGPRSSRSSSRRATPGMRVERLEHKLGIRASDTAVIIFDDCRVPAENLLGSPRSTPSRASPARWRPSTTPARWWPRWPSAVPGPRST